MDVSGYLQQLREKSDLSWGELSRRSDIPVSTVRDIVCGVTKRPSADDLASIVQAMGGSMDQLLSGELEELLVQEAPADERERLTLTVDELRRVREEMLEFQRLSYDREVAGLRKTVKFLRGCLIVVGALMVVLLIALVCWLIYDLTHPDRGWVQAYYGMDTGRGGLTGLLQNLLGGTI